MAIRASEKCKLPILDYVPRPRHNFTFLTPGWGEQRVMRHIFIPPSTNMKSLDKSQEGSEEKKNSSEDSFEKKKSVENLGKSEIPWNLRKKRAYGKDDYCAGVVNGVKNGKKKSLSVSLSLQEIENDFVLMSGKKPKRRPKKRTKHVQQKIDEVFPGMCLSEITPELYKVEEKK